MTSSLNPTQTKSTDSSSQQHPSINEILKSSNTPKSDDDPKITIPQIQFLLEGMRIKVAMIEAHDLAGSQCLGMGYGVEVQAKIFEVAEMRVEIGRLEECVEGMRRKERKGRRGRWFGCGWRRVRGGLGRVVRVVRGGDARRGVGDEGDLGLGWENGVGVRRVRGLRRRVETWIDELSGVLSHNVPM